MTLALDNNDIYDVLVDHCNHKPKAPSIDQFQYLATHHGQWPEQVMDSDKDEIVPEKVLSTTSYGLCVYL